MDDNCQDKSGSNGGKLARFSEGDVILAEGDDDYTLYKILSGHAELYLGYGTKQEVLLGIIGPQACFGELGLLLKKPSLYTVKAYSDVCVVRVTEDMLGDFIRQNHSTIVHIMEKMAEMMMTMQHQISQLSYEVDEKNKVNRTIVGKNKELLKKYALYGCK